MARGQKSKTRDGAQFRLADNHAVCYIYPTHDYYWPFTLYDRKYRSCSATWPKRMKLQKVARRPGGRDGTGRIPCDIKDPFLIGAAFCWTDCWSVHGLAHIITSSLMNDQQSIALGLVWSLAAKLMGGQPLTH